MKKTAVIILLLSLIFGLNQQATAQIVYPVKWKFYVKVKNDSIAELKARATIDKGWHLYGQYFEDGGPIKMVFKFNESTAYKKIGKVKEFPKPHTEKDEIFDIDVQFFDKKVVFTQKIKILSKTDFTVTGSFEGQACTDEGMCVKVPGPGQKNVDMSFLVKVKKETPTGDGSETTSTTETTPPPSNSVSETTGDSTETTTPTDTAVSPTSTVAKTTSSSDFSAEPETTNESLWWLFIVAFGAGLLAILTPCVFPMIPMTVTFFLHDKDGKGKIKALFFGASIIFIYVVLGTLVAAIFGPAAASVIATHWIPNLIFFAFFIIFAASFLGMFEIVLPNWIVQKSDEQADKGGFLAPFFMALTLAVVSFSCTGPIVGSLLFSSADGNFLAPVIGMFGFSLAFAIPFTLFAFFPQWLKGMKSGGWLNSVKVVLGFAELAFAFKFLSTADLTYHWGILDREVFLAIWIVIFSLLGFYLLGKLKLAHDSDLPHIKVPRLIMAITTFAFVVYMIPGMFGAPLKVLGGILPPAPTHDFDINAIVRNNIDAASFSGNSSNEKKSELCSTPKYGNVLHMPHGIKGYFDLDQGMACAKEQGKPVFLDFTGHGCQNCRKMEEGVWSDPEVLKILKNDYVVISLYVDDKSIELPKNEWVTSTFDGEVKDMYGTKWADYQTTRFKMNAQPQYVLLNNENELIAKPRKYNMDVKAYVKFLEDGLEEYKKSKR